MGTNYKYAWREQRENWRAIQNGEIEDPEISMDRMDAAATAFGLVVSGVVGIALCVVLILALVTLV